MNVSDLKNYFNLLFLPITVSDVINAHIQGSSGGTVKVARAHCESTYELTKLNGCRLDLRFKVASFKANMCTVPLSLEQHKNSAFGLKFRLLKI